MALTKVTKGIRTLGAGEVLSANIGTGEVSTANMAVDPTNASNLSSGSVPLAQLGNAPSTDVTGLRNDIATLALHSAIADNKAAYNLPNSFIDQFENDTGIGTETDGDRNSGEFWSTGGSGNCWATDGNTKFLLQSNTTNGSTTFTDESATGLTITVAGDTQHKTDQFKHGTSSIYFDGSGDQLYTSDGGATISGLNGGDFCVEMWLRKDSTFTYSNQNTFYMGGSDNQWEWTGGLLGSYNYVAFGGWTHINESTAASSDAWHHYAQVRDGNTHRFYVDGTQVDAGTGTGTGNFSNGIIKLGHHSSTASRYTKGWIDSVRVSNVARYPSGTTFSPPSSLPEPTGTLISTAQTASAAQTKVSGVIIYKNNAGTATLGTDLKIYFTCNGGTNWTESTPVAAGTFSTGILMAKCPEVTCTSGTDVRYKAVWANQSSGSKETQLHGIGMNY